MSSKSEIESPSRLDAVKLAGASAVIVGALVAFYYFPDESLLLRVVGLLVAVAIAVTIALTTERGREVWRFAQDARGELRKVDWPSRTETIQTSLAVFAMVTVLGLLLWLVDSLLLWIVRFLTG
jgi:preprotein translocase subunit SecE